MDRAWTWILGTLLVWGALDKGAQPIPATMALPVIAVVAFASSFLARWHKGR